MSHTYICHPVCIEDKSTNFRNNGSCDVSNDVEIDHNFEIDNNEDGDKKNDDDDDNKAKHHLSETLSPSSKTSKHEREKKGGESRSQRASTGVNTNRDIAVSRL